MTAPLPGQRLGSYEIVGVLGAGGMGQVYRAVDTRLGREVTLELLPGDLATGPERHARRCSSRSRSRRTGGWRPRTTPS